MDFNISLTRVTFVFNKYQGTGNDFIIADNRNRRFVPDRDIIARLCDRRFGIGADGLILIEKAGNAHFNMRYFNADGREATMCGNGGRCAAHYARSLGIGPEELTFMAADGLHKASVTENMVSLSMADVTEIAAGEDGFFLNTGSPHFVTFVNDTTTTDVVNIGRQIRYSVRFRPAGTNVNFVTVRNDRIVVRTYERGVEDETLSCGTGVTASAIAAFMAGRYTSARINVETLGGMLTVSFRAEGQTARDVALTGPAIFVFTGKIKL